MSQNESQDTTQHEEQQARELLDRSVECFNRTIHALENYLKVRANFIWKYDESGRKYLALGDVGALTPLQKEREEQLASETREKVILAEKELVVEGGISIQGNN